MVHPRHGLLQQRHALHVVRCGKCERRPAQPPGPSSPGSSRGESGRTHENRRCARPGARQDRSSNAADRCRDQRMASQLVCSRRSASPSSASRHTSGHCRSRGVVPRREIDSRHVERTTCGSGARRKREESRAAVKLEHVSSGPSSASSTVLLMRGQALRSLEERPRDLHAVPSTSSNSDRVVQIERDASIATVVLPAHDADNPRKDARSALRGRGSRRSRARSSVIRILPSCAPSGSGAASRPRASASRAQSLLRGGARVRPDPVRRLGTRRQVSPARSHGTPLCQPEPRSAVAPAPSRSRWQIV